MYDEVIFDAKMIKDNKIRFELKTCEYKNLRGAKKTSKELLLNSGLGVDLGSRFGPPCRYFIYMRMRHTFSSSYPVFLTTFHANLDYPWNLPAVKIRLFSRNYSFRRGYYTRWTLDYALQSPSKLFDGDSWCHEMPNVCYFSGEIGLLEKVYYF